LKVLVTVAGGGFAQIRLSDKLLWEWLARVYTQPYPGCD